MLGEERIISSISSSLNMPTAIMASSSLVTPLSSLEKEYSTSNCDSGTKFSYENSLRLEAGTLCQSAIPTFMTFASSFFCLGVL